MITSAEIYTKGPDMKAFSNEELKLFDADGFTRTYLKIKAKNIDDSYCKAICEIVGHQYKLPVKYLQPVKESCSYISQKAQLSGNEKDLRNANVTIEPLNADYTNLIQYTPINQSIPLGTIVTLEVDIPYESTADKNGNLIYPKRKFFWSSNLKTDKDIEAKIKAENPKSIRTKPWIECCHYGSVDIGSQIRYKFVVQNVNTKIVKSFSLFGFRRFDETKEFVMFTFKAFNITPIDVLKMIREMKDISKETIIFIDEVLKSAK